MWYEHYEYQVMSFELTNVSAMFQFYINNTLCDFLNICCMIYLNDIFIYLNSLKEHEKHVCMILNCLCDAWLFIKDNKYDFAINKVFFLNYIIESNNIKMKSDWIKIILEWSLLKSVKNIQFFLRFVNFYCRFINKYFKIITSLNNLIKSDKKEA